MEKDTVKKSTNIIIKGKSKGGKILVLKSDRSFLALIIQNPKLKELYSKIKNYCLSFSGVKARSSWGAESFTAGKDNLVKLIVRGGALCACFALSPDDYDPAEYPHKNCADLKTFENTPMLVPIRNGADYKIARRLAADAFTTHFIYPVEFPEVVDYAAKLRFEPDEVLVKKNLIKVTESFMNVSDAEKMFIDDVVNEEMAAREIKEIWSSYGKEPRKKKPKPEPPKAEPIYVMRYDRSFVSRIIQNEGAKHFYSEIKNFCAALGLKPRMSWAGESFYHGRKTYMKAKVRGKTLRLFLALDPSRFDVKRYHQKDFSDKKSYRQFPMMIKVKSELGVKKAKRLIAFAVAERGLIEREIERVDYAAMYPYEETKALLDKGLIKLVKSKVTEGMFMPKSVLASAEEFSLEKAKEEAKAEPTAETPIEEAPVEETPIEAPVEEVSEQPAEEIAEETTEEATEEPIEEPEAEPIEEAETPAEETEQEESAPEEAIAPEEEIPEQVAEQPEEPTEEPIEEAVEEEPAEEPIEEESAPEEEDEIEDVDFELDEEEKDEESEEEDIEDIEFELAEDETESEDDVEDVSFELAEDDDVDEDVTFELVEEEKPAEEETPAAHEALNFDENGDASAYDSVDKMGRYVTLKKYVRGFTAKMKQGSPERKDFYSEIKSTLLSLKGVKLRDSFSGETFYKGRVSLVKSRIRGKTLCLFLALNVDDYKQTVYHQQYKGETKAYADTPMLIRVKSEQGLQRALRLIDEIARVYSLAKGEKQSYRKEYNYEETPELVEKGLIKTRLVSVPYYEAQELLKKQNK
ncbi:MAG: hypothetical protein K5753_05375 [Clostridia bacterium]|nr:hypothetical protein [Clostridia bacterium]